MEFLLMINFVLFVIIISILVVNTTKNKLRMETDIEKQALRLERQQTKRKREPKLSYMELMAILDNMITSSYTIAYLTDFNLTDTVVIGDFANDLSVLTKEVLINLSPEFYNDLQYYHTEEYIMLYVIRKFKLLLMQLLREKKVGIR